MSKTGHFDKVPIHVQDKSGFDMSFEHVLTLPGAGTLVPVLCKRVMPGDVWSVGQMSQVKLPPMACDFYGRVDLRMEAFFVPSRVLYGGFKHFIINDPNYSPNVPDWTAPSHIPEWSIPSATETKNKLFDYLGYKRSSSPSGGSKVINALPFLGYKKIIDDWYRQANLSKPFFCEGVPSDISSADITEAMYAPYCNSEISWNMDDVPVGYNNEPLYSLNQRCYSKDYFTTGTTAPQGSAKHVTVNVVGLSNTPSSGKALYMKNNGEVYTSAADGSIPVGFTIQQLRVANKLQQWLEKNNLAGVARYYDNILAHFGVRPSDAHLNRAILLGTDEYSIVTNSVRQTSGEASTPSGNNFGTLGDAAGSSNGFGKGRLIDNFEATEFGYIYVLASVVPHAYYSSGIDRMFRERTMMDYPFPEFASIGDQPIYLDELSNSPNTGDRIFAYQERYSDLKVSNDIVSGEFMDYINGSSGTLKNMVLQRSVTTSGDTINTSFLEIPTNALDGQLNVSNKLSGFIGMMDIYFDAKVLRTLPEYSMPAL